jgi:hypothetical protein
VNTGYFSHIDDTGKNPVLRYRRNGGTSLVAGEVLGKGDKVESIFEAWKSSPDHYDLILDPRWTHAGVGVAETEQNELVIVILCIEMRARIAKTVYSETGIVVNGQFNQSAGAPVAEINNQPVDVIIQPGFEKNGDEVSFQIVWDMHYDVYLIRFGYQKAEYVVWTESYIFERP